MVKRKNSLFILAAVMLFACAVLVSHLASLPPIPVPEETPMLAIRPALSPRPPSLVAPKESGETAIAAAPEERTESDKALPEDAIAGEYALTFFNARDREAFEALAARQGIRILDRLAAANALRIAVPDAAALHALLRSAPSPLTLLPNIHVRLPPLPEGRAAQAPATPYDGFGTGALDWLGVPDPRPEWGTGVRVAVLDTGIPAEFAGRVAARMDLTGEGLGEAAHGGAVASLINGLQGMVPGAELLGIKVLPDSGTGDAFTLARGIIEATDRGAGVINISAGTRGESEVLRAAVAYALARNVLLVAAAGNDGLPGVNYPAGYDGVVAVGGVDAAGRHLYFSNTGAAVDLSAPGIGIAVPSAAAGGGLAAFSGTSAATPFVAAAAALLRSESPGLTPTQIVALLKRYSNDTEAPGQDEATGAGVLDAGRLLARHEPGLVDMAAIRPYVRREGGRVLLDVFAQNRGTVALPEVAMEITQGSQTQTLRFAGVGIGETILHTLDLRADQFDRDGVDIIVNLRPVGQVDVQPKNNAIRAVILPIER
jgi:thermitase